MDNIGTWDEDVRKKFRDIPSAKAENPHQKHQHHVRVLCVQWHQNRMPSILDFFDFYKYSLGFERTFWSLYTSHRGLICAISSKSYDWNSSESERKRPKLTLLPYMQLWLFHYLGFLFSPTIKVFSLQVPKVVSNSPALVFV